MHINKDDEQLAYSTTHIITRKNNDEKLPTKISPVQDWWSTLHNWPFCHIQSHATPKLQQISKLRPNQSSGQLLAPIVNGRGDSFWKWQDFLLWRAREFDLGSGHTAYRRASFIDLYLHAKFCCNWRNFYGQTYTRTDGCTFKTHFIRSTQKSGPISRQWLVSCMPMYYVLTS